MRVCLPLQSPSCGRQAELDMLVKQSQLVITRWTRSECEGEFLLATDESVVVCARAQAVKAKWALSTLMARSDSKHPQSKALFAHRVQSFRRDAVVAALVFSPSTIVITLSQFWHRRSSDRSVHVVPPMIEAKGLRRNSVLKLSSAGLVCV